MRFGEVYWRWRRSRTLLYWELAVVLLCVLLHIWEPADWLTPQEDRPRWRLFFRGLSVGLGGTFFVGSMIRWRHGPNRLGLTRRRLVAGWRSMGVFTAVSLAVLVAVGPACGAVTDVGALATWVFRYLPTLVFQQLLLQWFFNNRVHDLARGGERRRVATAVGVSTTVFVVAHAPNPVLMGAVAWAGTYWCLHFRRHGNLAAVLASHLVLGVATMTLLGGAALNLRVGYSALTVTGD